jgi:hypothetical protein
MRIGTTNLRRGVDIPVRLLRGQLLAQAQKDET